MASLYTVYSIWILIFTAGVCMQILFLCCIWVKIAIVQYRLRCLHGPHELPMLLMSKDRYCAIQVTLPSRDSRASLWCIGGVVLSTPGPCSCCNGRCSCLGWWQCTAACSCVRQVRHWWCCCCCSTTCRHAWLRLSRDYGELLHHILYTLNWLLLM